MRVLCRYVCEFQTFSQKNCKAFGYVIFEGEYLAGKRWKGKGKKYDDKGNLISEDNYLEGKIIEN